MQNTSYIALSRQMTMARELELVANNIANAETTAYRGERMMFTDFLHDPDNAPQTHFARDVAVVRNLAQGRPIETGAPLDVMIDGDGYFQVETPFGPRYTRNGKFTTDADGRLITTTGDPVMAAGGGTIVVPLNQGPIQVGTDGTVATDAGPLAQIALMRFDSDFQLRKTQSGLYATDAQPQEVEEPKLVQGMVEGSNVQPVVEMTRMMSLLRAFESAQKVIDTEHENQRRAVERILRQA
ncbi:flagellar basal-body rod protein FlgF [Tistrella bauzanensis]|jgi:flagellar basal-body rod protein FlgF|uniref:Flagellar basal-body rod protein FlgF n=1 Tax=Tistrella arctica TaxID=3133430 RepID=A0ABU9YIB6_9PROT